MSTTPIAARLQREAFVGDIGCPLRVRRRAPPTARFERRTLIAHGGVPEIAGRDPPSCPGAPPPPVRLLLGAIAVVALAACKVDATVDVTIGPDGTGSVTVTAVADAEVVQQAPGLAGDLRFDDAKAAGWTVDGPTATPDGGLRVVLTHPVTSAADATNVLNSLGPPFVGMKLDRVVTDGGDGATTTLSGQLALTGGFDAFADADLTGRRSAGRRTRPRSRRPAPPRRRR